MGRPRTPVRLKFMYKCSLFVHWLKQHGWLITAEYRIRRGTQDFPPSVHLTRTKVVGDSWRCGNTWSISSGLATISWVSIEFQKSFSQLHTVKYVPSWVPGAGFKTKAKEWRVEVEACVEEPFNFVKDQLVRASKGSWKTKLKENTAKGPGKHFCDSDCFASFG